ncbi:MAG: hypothetical protein WBB45_08595 [Cyclobacteriaceae bacterium]
MKKKAKLEAFKVESFVTDRQKLKAGYKSAKETYTPVCPTENTACFVCPPYTYDCPVS